MVLEVALIDVTDPAAPVNVAVWDCRSDLGIPCFLALIREHHERGAERDRVAQSERIGLEPPRLAAARRLHIEVANQEGAMRVWDIELRASTTESAHAVEASLVAGPRGVMRARTRLRGVDDPRLRVVATRPAGASAGCHRGGSGGCGGGTIAGGAGGEGSRRETRRCARRP